MSRAVSLSNVPQWENFSKETRERLESGVYPLEKVSNYWKFYQTIQDQVLNHKVIAANPYTGWFAQGVFAENEARNFITQFSVFSNEFLVAQLRKMLNADSLDEMRASKEILANEIGVTFRDVLGKDALGNNSQKGDSELGDLVGSVNGGVFRFKAAHFELLVRMAEHLGLSFNDLGKRKFGTETTLYFCDELIRLYGSDDYAVATAASFAVENWAAAGFWDELVEGWNIFKKRECADLPLVFFSWHAKVEANHAQHTQDELEEFYFSHEVDEESFILNANEMLEGVYAFWHGLSQRSL